MARLSRYSLFALALIMAGLGGSPALAGKLVIGPDSTLTIRGGRLDTHCQQILVKDRGALLLQDGTLVGKGKVTVENGGSYLVTGGREVACERTFILSFTEEGKPIIYCLPAE